MGTQWASMCGITHTQADMVLIFLSSLILLSEGCIRVQDFKYVPESPNFYNRQCVPCKKSDEARGRGSIWSEMYNGYEGLSEDPSPRFGFPVGPVITTAAPCCESTTTTTPAPTEPPITRLQNATGCGEKGSNRIVGGEEAGENEFPWMCAIMNSDDSFYTCGATILSCNPTIIVSAAHCFEGSAGQPGGKKVSCGGHRMNAYGSSAMDSAEQRLDITEIINHPDYSSLNNGGDSSNDIAVIKVDGNFNCAAGKIWPACLPDKNRLTYEGWAKTTVTGWGTLTEGGALPDKLQKVKVAPINDLVCDAALGGGRIKDVMICAGPKEGGRDSCQGDSGGPLVTRDDRPGFSLIGVVSFGDGCARADSYGVYTEVSYYLDWIAGSYGLSPVET